MKRTGLFLLMILCACIAFTEAMVLDTGTKITSPQGSFFVLSSPSFLLSRADMEVAVENAEMNPVLEENLKALEKENASLSLELKTWKIVAGAGLIGTVLGTVIGLLLGASLQ